MKLLNYIFLMILSVLVYSQGLTLDPLRKADAYYKQFSYAKAVEFYKMTLDNEAFEEGREGYIINQIALSYKNLNMPDSSEVWLKKTIEHVSDNDPINYYYLGESLMENGKYAEARYWFDEYEKLAPNDQRVQKKLSAIDNIGQFNDPLFDASIERAEFNSPGLDFSPAFYKSGIVFVSSRPQKGWVKSEFNWDESTFLDLYRTDSDSGFSASILDEGLNTPYHEGSLVFYNDDRSVVYTRNNYDGKRLGRDDKGVANLKIFFATWSEEEKKWVNEEPFKYNSDSYSNGAPAISNDGQVLIYSSDMEGGYGASDLYVCFRETDGWSKPKNLGPNINTKGRDGFAFLDEDRLFFASDGREGLGGLDIYTVPFDGNSIIGTPKNVGQPFNSSKDDFGLIIRNSEGYFTTNRNGDTGDDIYRILVKEPVYYLVRGEVFDQDTNVGLAKADVFFKNADGDFLYTRSKASGKYEISAPLGSSWSVFAGKFQYERIDSLSIELSEMDTIDLRRIYLRKEGSIDTDTIDLSGVYPVVDNREKPYDYTSHFIDMFDNGDTLKAEIVYFELDSYDVAQTYKSKLNRLANFLIEHVDIKVILSSHTDSRSTQNYNEKLSRKRSKEVADYLKWMGVDMDRMYSVAVGERELTNDCGDNTTCTEEEHQANRRTEIWLVKTAERFHY